MGTPSLSVAFNLTFFNEVIGKPETFLLAKIIDSCIDIIITKIPHYFDEPNRSGWWSP